MRKKTSILFLSMLVLGMTIAVVPSVALFDRVTPFVYGEGSSPGSFDPLGAYDHTSFNVMCNVFETLYATDYETGKTVNRLADGPGVWNNESTIWTIPLRDDVTWHDGSAFTADDVVWNFERLETLSDSADCHHASLWYNDEKDFILNSTVASGTNEVTFNFAKTWFDFEKLLPFTGTSMIKPVTGAENTLFDLSNFTLMSGTGPFMLDSYTPDEKTVMLRYDDYYRGAASIEKLIFQIFGSGDAMDQAFLNHEIQVARGVGADAAITAEADPDLTIVSLKGSAVFFYHLHVDNIPRDARAAMSYALNYTYLIDIVRDGRGYEIHTPIPEGMDGHNPDVEGLPYYNLSVARDIILNSAHYATKVAAAGLDEESTDADWEEIADSDTLVLDTFNYTDYGAEAYYDQMANNFADIGFKIIYDTVGDWQTFLTYTDENKDNLQITMGGWGPDYYDPVNMIEPLFGTNASSNWNGLANATIDANLALMHSTVGELKDNITDLVVEQIFVHQVAAMYLWQRRQFANYNNVQVENAEVLLNINGDKYFYDIIFHSETVPSGIPGYSLGIFIFAALGASAALIIRKRK